MTHQAAFLSILNMLPLSHAIENHRAAGTARFDHKTSIDILSEAVRQLP
jgi:hypothetical protein